MRLDLDTEIRFPNGERAGTLRRIVLDAKNEVMEVVMATSDVMSRDVIVPLNLLSEAPGDVLTINATPDEVDRLQGFEESEEPAIPDDWDFNEDAIPGADAFPKTFYQPLMPITEVPNLPEGLYTLSQGTEVWCLDGRWGLVDEVLTGDNGRITAFVARPDETDEHDRIIPIELVQQLDENVVLLSCNIAELPDYSQETVTEVEEPDED